MSSYLALLIGLLMISVAPGAADVAPAERQAQKVIIDADPGIDDSIAILFALRSPALDVLGITTVFGNADIERATLNALRLVELAGRRVSVARGASSPWIGETPSPPDFVHGSDGIGNIDTPPPTTAPIDVGAARFIVETVRSNPGEVRLLALGRLTNLAVALAIEPALPSLVKQVVLMGGAAPVPGNVSPVAEANIAGDPHAADIVLSASWKVTMVGLDVTTQVRLTESVLERLAHSNDIGAFIYRITRFYKQFYESIGVTGGFYVHDPSAVAYLIDPDIFSTQDARVRVATEGIARGQTITAPLDAPEEWKPWHDAPAVAVAVAVDADRLLRLLESTLTRRDLGRHPASPAGSSESTDAHHRFSQFLSSISNTVEVQHVTSIDRSCCHQLLHCRDLGRRGRTAVDP